MDIQQLHDSLKNETGTVTLGRIGLPTNIALTLSDGQVIETAEPMCAEALAVFARGVAIPEMLVKIALMIRVAKEA